MGGPVLELSYPVQRFIEDNISLLEEEEYTLFFYLTLFNLPNVYGKELVEICKNVLGIDTDTAIQGALVNWCKDNVALKSRKKVGLSQLLRTIPNFGFDSLKFRWMLVDAIKIAYPNKTISPDSYGIEYIEEKR